MNEFSVSIDWRFVAALGVSVCCGILVSKISADAAERVLTHAVDAFQGLAVDGNINC